jgi:hypothetical protein
MELQEVGGEAPRPNRLKDVTTAIQDDRADAGELLADGREMVDKGSGDGTVLPPKPE